jgi:hypothetical protein
MSSISLGRLARTSSVAMLASGVAAVLKPELVALALHLSPTDARGRAESRAGFGGTFAALGAYGLLSRSPAAQRAVGVTWLGAAAARLAALRLDEPETDVTYWAYLAGEVGLGAAALIGAGGRSQGRLSR